jgi:hypothetical protein
MTQERRPPVPGSESVVDSERTRPAPGAEQKSVDDVRHRVGDAVQAQMPNAAAKPANHAEPHPHSPAGRLKRLYDVWAMPVHFSLHLKADGFNDVVIEKLWKNRVSLTHYGEQNGDLMKDPDVEVLLLPDGTIRGVSYQNDYVGVYHTCEDDPPEAYRSRSLQAFLALWLRELHEQGFATPSPAESRRRAEALEKFLRDDEDE